VHPARLEMKISSNGFGDAGIQLRSSFHISKLSVVFRDLDAVDGRTSLTARMSYLEKLPSELILMILNFAYSPDEDGMKFAKAISQTSRRIRSVALGNSRLWSTVSNRQPLDECSLFLSRAQVSKLKVLVHLKRLKPGQTFTNTERQIEDFIDRLYPFYCQKRARGDERTGLQFIEDRSDCNVCVEDDSSETFGSLLYKVHFGALFEPSKSIDEILT
jgi:hypothetical protein